MEQEKNSGNKNKKQDAYSQAKVLNTFSGKEILASSHPNQKKRKVKLYDFKRPDKFSRDQIRTLAVMHQTYANLTTTSLSAQLRYLCILTLEIVDQMTFEEYAHELPNPSTIGVINMDPLKGSALMHIDNTLTFPIIERLAGRSEVEAPGYNRDLTDIEGALMEGIFVRMIANFREAWSTVIDLRPRLGQVETNPQFVQIVPPPEMVVVVGFECKLHTVKGRITLCIPYLALEPIVPRLSAKYWYSSVVKKQPDTMVPVSHLKADAFVFYKSEHISLYRLHTLSCGSLIKVPALKNGEAYLSCGREHVLKLKTIKRNGPCLSFTITQGKAGTDILPDGLLIESAAKTAKTKEQEIAHIVSEAIRPLEKKLLQGYRSIENQLKGFAARQDELSDQLYFGSKDKELQETEKEKHIKPFHFLHSFETDHIMTFIRCEHPQVIALILAYLEPFYSSELLSRYPEPLQVDIAERIATMDRTAPAVLHEIERVLKKKLAFTDKIQSAGGIDSIVEILNLTGRNVEKTILGGLEKTDRKLAGAIKKKMFLFDHIKHLSPRAVMAVFEKTDMKDFVLAIKGSSPDVRDHILNCLDVKAREAAIANLKETGPVRVQDVETARQKIIETIRTLENEGIIIIAKTGELVE